MISSIFSNRKICVFLCAVMLLSAMFSYDAYAYTSSSFGQLEELSGQLKSEFDSKSHDSVGVSEFIIFDGFYYYYGWENHETFDFTYVSRGDAFCINNTLNWQVKKYDVNFDYVGYVNSAYVMTASGDYYEGGINLGLGDGTLYYSYEVNSLDDYAGYIYVIDYQHTKQVSITGMLFTGLSVNVKGIGTGTLRVENVGTGEVRFVSLSAPQTNYIIPVEYDNTYNISFNGTTTAYIEFYPNTNYMVNDIMKEFTMSTGNTYKIITSQGGYIKFKTPKSGVYYTLQKNEEGEMAYLLDSDSLTDFKQNLNDNTEYYFRIEVLPSGLNTVTVEYEGTLEDCVEELVEVPDEVIETVLSPGFLNTIIEYDIYKTNILNNYMQFKNISEDVIQINLSSTGNGYGMLFTRDFDTDTQTNKDIMLNSFTYDSSMNENYIKINPGDYIEFYQESGELSLKVAQYYVQNTDYTLIKSNMSWAEVVANNPSLAETYTTPTDPASDLNTGTYEENPYINKSDAQVWFENSESMSITDALEKVGSVKTKAMQFLNWIMSFAYGIPGMGDMYQMILYGGVAVFFIKLIF